MYAGKPTYNLADITDDERREYWQESLDTYLKAPWEFVDFHFFIEAVSRAFTHQMVRQRTAVYAQESLRFAVKEGFAQEIPLPPGVMGNENAETFWYQCMRDIEKAYNALINLGIPAEDARGLLPHATTTRLNYKVNLRGLLDVAEKRLCTQAQFEWRAVMLGIMKSIREYDGPSNADPSEHSAWQFQLIGKPIPGTFAPICYKLGRCPYMGVLDRNCTIRARVEANNRHGRRAEEWGEPHVATSGETFVEAIDPIEWMANPEAGRGRDAD
jgi:flavin-dependent thymidylate synthase